MRLRLCTVLFLGAITAMATNLPAQTAEPPQRNPLDLAFTWDGMHSDIAGGGSFWMQGAGVQLHQHLFAGLGAVADFAGTHTGQINSTGVGLNLLTVTLGPRWTWTHHNVSIYGQGLAGQAFGFDGLFPAQRGANTSDNSLAAEAGGGVSLALRPHLALRLLEADWVRTQLPNSAANAQNNLRLGAGIVFRVR